MIRFEPEYFKKLQITPAQIESYLRNSFRDLDIAQKDSFIEVQFSYGYQALIKAGIALIAKAGSVKVRSVPGHHVKILERMSEILKNPDVLVIGNAMRMKRNLDLYEGGTPVGENEVSDYLEFVEEVLKVVHKFIQDHK